MVILRYLGVAGMVKCAIPECNNPCFVDGQGKVFECCGYTHAMELQRRKALYLLLEVKLIFLLQNTQVIMMI